MLDKDVFTRDTLRLVTSEVKRFEVDNRKELIQKFLPESLSGDALQEILKEIISKNSYTEMRDMGNIMKELKSKHPNAEMSEASSLVKSLLS